MYWETAENFSFLVLDEIQGYHWIKSQCSIHSVVVYFLSNGVLTESSLCILSEDLDHDVGFVYKVLNETMNYIKKDLNPSVKTIHYFSDGCAVQYKNCKHFINLCHHANDFSVDCVWNVFATSHGKSTCDGIGCTVKRLTAGTSLQCPVSSQILSAKWMFEFCQDSIHGIKFVYTPSGEIYQVRTVLTSRFSLARTIPVPVSATSIKMKRVADDNKFEIEFDFLGIKSPVDRIEVENIKMSQYLLCKYDDQYWIGIVLEIDQTASDVRVKFMHPQYPSSSFNWPSRDGVCWVPRSHIVTEIETPLLSSISARQYNVSRK